MNLLDPEFKKPTRIYYAFTEKGKKVRVSKLSGEIIAKPEREHLTYKARTEKR